MTEGVKEKYDQMIEEGLTLQRRWGKPEDVGRVVACLASGDMAYSTGQVILVDGDMTVGRLLVCFEDFIFVIIRNNEIVHLLTGSLCSCVSTSQLYREQGKSGTDYIFHGHTGRMDLRWASPA